ncbi:MAG: arginyltransferase [Bacteroidales bacterium]|nr:arginyltransferase [Bacteroidales bacterium]
MQSLYTFTSPPYPCSYLPERSACQEYEIMRRLSAEEYEQRMRAGWRRFGHSLFRPVCRSCRACQSLRVDVARFRPSATQKRVMKQNALAVELTIQTPQATDEKLALYDKFHAFQAGFKGWPLHEPKSVADYVEGFVHNPFPTEEWCYRLHDGRLIGVGYVDHLPASVSAIYFFYDPEERHRSLGVWNVLSVLRFAAEQPFPYAYLGYYVAGCPSLEYKAKYRPNEVLNAQGDWEPFLS